MADPVCLPASALAVPITAASTRHPAVVRVTHWLTALCFLALLVTGVEILLSHPRFYWGESGSVLTTPLFKLPLPASRSSVPTAYGYVLPDQNGWSRYLHFQAAWLAVFTGLTYFTYGWSKGHFRRNLIPSRASVAEYFTRGTPDNKSAVSYNVPQRLTYLTVIFVLFPLVIWTGLAMSPAIASAFPPAVILLGGQQSARTIHFFVSVFLFLFFVVHIFMVCISGFRGRMRAMIGGRSMSDRERP